MPIPRHLRDPKRRFTNRERIMLYLDSDGQCEHCGSILLPDWEADHKDPHCEGGRTVLINGAALCSPCNQEKGSTVVYKRRGWQQTSLETYLKHEDTNYVICVAPGGGKTCHVCDLTRIDMDHQRIEQVIIVVSTRGIGEGFKLEATKNGLTIDWIENGKGTSKISGSDSDGFITTYAAVASMPLLYALKVGQKPTMIIFDEFHHMGENSVWGDSCLLAFGAAKKRIFITGTAWRSDGTPIPFVDYLDRYVRSDYSYDWDQAWADKIIRRVSFYEIDADVEVGGEFIKLSEVTPDNVTDCFRSLYNSKSDWCRKTFELANADLMERRRIRPNAAGLIIVRDTNAANEYAPVFESLTGIRPVVIHGEVTDIRPVEEINRFRDGTEPWLIAVRMISEGVNIPRLEVEIYASVFQAALSWQQAVGRVVRIPDNETDQVEARVYFPGTSELLANAHDLQRKMALADKIIDQNCGWLEHPTTQTASAHLVAPARNAEFIQAIVDGEDFPASLVSNIETYWVSHGFTRQDALNAYRKGFIKDDDLMPSDIVLALDVADHQDISAEQARRNVRHKEYNRMVKRIGMKLWDSKASIIGIDPSDQRAYFKHAGSRLQNGKKVADMSDEEMELTIKKAQAWLDELGN